MIKECLSSVIHLPVGEVSMEQRKVVSYGKKINKYIQKRVKADKERNKIFKKLVASIVHIWDLEN